MIKICYLLKHLSDKIPLLKITRRENKKIATIYHNANQKITPHKKFDIALTYEIIKPNILFVNIISLYNLHHRNTSGVQNST